MRVGAREAQALQQHRHLEKPRHVSASDVAKSLESCKTSDERQTSDPPSNMQRSSRSGIARQACSR
eukprot:963687-Rhodomonas_salina.1